MSQSLQTKARSDVPNYLTTHSFETVVQKNVETTRHAYYKLMKGFVRVLSPVRAAGNIVKIINSLDVERDVVTTFHKREVATLIHDFGQVNDTAISERHGVLIPVRYMVS